MSTAHRILGFLRDRQGEMVALLEQLARIESPSVEPDTHNAVLTLLERALAASGMRSRRVSDRGGGRHLLARPRDRAEPRPYQLLLGHIDTVWPVGTLGGMPLRQDGEHMHGPGVYDMKAGLVQIVFALEAIHSLDLAMAVTPVAFVNSDEEIGSRGSRRYIERLARRADRAFVLEPSLGPEGRLKTSRKGVGRYTIRVRGRAAHAGLDPHAGASAILELSHQIQRLFSLNDVEAGVSVNVGTIDGGLRPNVVAPESRAVVDVRVPDHASAQRVHAAIHGLKPVTPGVELEIEGAIGRPPMEFSTAGLALWAIARDAADELGIDLDHGAAGGGSDGNITAQYTATLDGLGAVGDGAHAHHEFVRLDKLAERTALLALLVLAPPTAHSAPPSGPRR